MTVSPGRLVLEPGNGTSTERIPSGDSMDLISFRSKSAGSLMNYTRKMKPAMSNDGVTPYIM